MKPSIAIKEEDTGRVPGPTPEDKRPPPADWNDIYNKEINIKPSRPAPPPLPAVKAKEGTESKQRLPTPPPPTSPPPNKATGQAPAPMSKPTAKTAGSAGTVPKQLAVTIPSHQTSSKSAVEAFGIHTIVKADIVVPNEVRFMPANLRRVWWMTQTLEQPINETEARHHEQATGVPAICRVYLGPDSGVECCEESCTNHAILMDHDHKMYCEGCLWRSCPKNPELWTTFTMTIAANGKLDMAHIPPKKLCRTPKCSVNWTSANKTSYKFNYCNKCGGEYDKACETEIGRTTRTMWSEQEYIREMQIGDSTPNYTADDLSK